MRKTIFLALAAVACFGLLLACPDGGNGGGGGDTKYTVTFYKNDGSTGAANVIKTVSVVKGKTVGADMPANPTRSGYTFSKWTVGTAVSGQTFTGSTEVTSKTDVYAQWNSTGSGPTKWTVSFDVNGGTMPAGFPASIEVEDNTAAGDEWPADPTHATQTFGGWFKGTDTVFANRFDKTVLITEALSLKARWTSNNKATVTYRIGHTDPSGATPAADLVSQEVTGTYGNVTVAAPTRTEAWGAGMTFVGWFTAAEGGTNVTNTEIPASGAYSELFAHWTFVNGAPTVAGNVMTIIAPYTDTNTGDGGKQGSWKWLDPATDMNADGSFSYDGGAIRAWWGRNATDDTPITGIEDYDFVTVTYVSKPNPPNADMNVILKQGITDVDYMPLEGSDNQWPVLSTGASGGTFKFFIKEAGTTGAAGFEGDTAGIAFQRNNRGGTAKFTKFTFTKGTRHTITFDAGYTGAASIDDGYGVEGFKLVKLPGPGRTGFNFSGWYDGDDLVSGDTVMGTAAMALTAKWTAAATGVTTLEVGLTTENTTPTGGTRTVTDGVLSFKRTSGYQDSFIKIAVTLGTGASIADYDRITFTLHQKDDGITSDNPNYKDCGVLAGKPLPATVTNMQASLLVTQTVQYTSGPQPINLAIGGDGTSATALALTGAVELCIYTHSPAGTLMEISALKLVKD